MKALDVLPLSPVALPLRAASARLVQLWPYDKLTSEADLIVIGTPVSVRDTEEKTTLPGIRRGNDPVPAIAMETTFDVLSLLKGDANVKRFVFHHLREENVPAAQKNGPALVSFDPQQKRRYLLFLKLETDGRYSSVAGQTDPDHAVKDLGTTP